jgi:hypothetical protein
MGLSPILVERGFWMRQNAAHSLIDSAGFNACRKRSRRQRIQLSLAWQKREMGGK